MTQSTPKESSLHEVETSAMELEARWAESLAQWAIPEEYLAEVQESPFRLSPEAFTPDLSRRETPSMQFAIEALSELAPGDRSLLDVGCASGGTSLILFPPAERLIAIDQSAEMLEQLIKNAAALGVEASAIQVVNSAWPTDPLPRASVVTCANVLYNVASPLRFIQGLIDAADHAVVIEITARHPHYSANPIWWHFYHYQRPVEPGYEMVAEILKHLGYQPTISKWQRDALDPNDDLALARLAQRCCIPPSRLAELKSYLEQNPLLPTEVVSMAFRKSGG